ncbi:MAG TPA: AlpA family transcriptional regulator [Silvibacterium sp.]|nr:AlpA family transcriptional regulator [Silvibacterium sp.]
MQNRVEVALTSVGFALEQWADALFWLSHVTNQLQMKQLRYICALFWFFHALPLESKTLIVRKSNRRYMSEKSVKFLRLVEVQRRVPFSRSTIYLKISRGEFPQPINLGARAVAWLESDIDEWIAARIKSAGVSA